MPTDNFNRANENPLAGNWSTTGDATGMQLLTNQVRGSTAAQTNAAHWSAATFANDQYSQATLANIADQGGVTVRAGASGASPKGYLWFYPNEANIMRLYKWAGTGPDDYTQIGSDYSVTIGAGTVLKLQVSGTTLTPFVAGVSQATQTDSSWADGAAGLQAFGNALDMDDWEGADLAAADTQIPMRRLFPVMLYG